MSGCVVTNDTTPSGPTGPNYKYPDETSFCNAVAAAECSDAVVNACFGSTTVAPADRQTCISARSELSRCNPGSLPYHPETAETCVNAIQALYATGTWTQADTRVKAASTACVAVLSKSGPAGSMCTTDTDCDAAHGLSCVFKANGGTCEQPHAVAGGEKCPNPADQCPADQYCDGTKSACIAKNAVGDACDPMNPYALPCDDTSKCSAVTMKCVAKTADGMPCATDAECAGGFCTIPENATGTPPAGSKCGSAFKLNSLATNCDPFTKP
jgi:hypothetical protein